MTQDGVVTVDAILGPYCAPKAIPGFLQKQKDSTFSLLYFHSVTGPRLLRKRTQLLDILFSTPGDYTPL